MSEHENLASALVAALAELTVVEKGRTAKIDTKGGQSYSYSFADIADIVKATRPVLAGHGLAALTPVHGHGDGLAVTVTLLHTSGERLDFDPFPFPHGTDARATGSMVTYHRRYALVAALGMAVGDDDDDGAAAKPRERQRQPLPSPLATDEQHNRMDEWRNLATDEDKAELNAWYKAQLNVRLENLTVDQADRVLAHMAEIDRRVADLGRLQDAAADAETGVLPLDDSGNPKP